MMESRWDSSLAGDATGSSVCNGSGTMPAQTTIWYAVLIKFQVSAKKRKRRKRIILSDFVPVA